MTLDERPDATHRNASHTHTVVVGQYIDNRIHIHFTFMPENDILLGCKWIKDVTSCLCAAAAVAAAVYASCAPCTVWASKYYHSSGAHTHTYTHTCEHQNGEREKCMSRENLNALYDSIVSFFFEIRIIHQHSINLIIFHAHTYNNQSSGIFSIIRVFQIMHNNMGQLGTYYQYRRYIFVCVVLERAHWKRKWV